MPAARWVLRMIELRNVSVSLPHGRAHASTILHDINLSIGSGDWVTIAGPNGSGKTTLLKTIAGLLAVSTGEVTMNGVGGPGTVALLLQEPDNQFVASSVRNELILSLPHQAGESERRERLARAIEQFSLAALLDRNPHRLSGGEKQRLACATVWMSNPRLLLLDEPTSYLDTVERERCMRFVEDLNRDGVAVVWATPAANDAPGGRRLVYINHGRLEFDGTRDDFGRWHGNDGAADTVPAGPRQRAAALGDPVAIVDSVYFAYDDRPVFNGLSMELREGECVTVTGRNGTGKSTLLGLLGGVLEPSRGQIHRTYRRSVEHGRQNTFLLFQNPERLFFAETVFEEIAFGLKALKIPKHEISSRVDESLTRVGLPSRDFRDRMPFSLSFGEMRRVSFAMTLALDPRFLLLDEPASCLDASGWAVLYDLLAHLRGMGRTVVLASHDGARFAHSADRLIELLPGGRLL